jgi:hypothetical protein
LGCISYGNNVEQANATYGWGKKIFKRLHSIVHQFVLEPVLLFYPTHLADVYRLVFATSASETIVIGYGRRKWGHHGSDFVWERWR